MPANRTRLIDFLETTICAAPAHDPSKMPELKRHETLASWADESFEDAKDIAYLGGELKTANMRAWENNQISKDDVPELPIGYEANARARLPARGFSGLPPGESARSGNALRTAKEITSVFPQETRPGVALNSGEFSYGFAPAVAGFARIHHSSRGCRAHRAIDQSFSEDPAAGAAALDFAAFAPRRGSNEPSILRTKSKSFL